ncbi:MAG: efflux RND transporter periplasmic adaptor subunit [Myxococcota bacterium]
MSKARKYLQPLLVLVVVAAGAGVLSWLKATKPQADRQEEETPGLLVETVTATRTDHEVSVQAQGTVMPARRVVVQPEVGGRVVWQHPELVPGGHLDKGDRLIRIDPRDYRLALEARRADVSRAQLELRLERGQQEVAKREWEKFGSPSEAEDTDPDGGTLALREPHVQTARVAVESAESALEQAKLNLERTTLRAPFNALVMQENVDDGQLVSSQTQVATLVGTDRFWVQVAVPVEALAHIPVPGRNGAEEGSAVRVRQDAGGQRVEREGRVLKILPDLDAGGSMARVLVGIDDPLGLADESGEEGKLPLLLNSYVQVEIDAPAVRDAIEVPRVALRDGDQVYVAGEDAALRIRNVQILWRRPSSVLVGRGLEEGDRIIVSRVPAPVEGMRVRMADRATEPEDPAVADAEADAAPPPGEKL